MLISHLSGMRIVAAAVSAALLVTANPAAAQEPVRIDAKQVLSLCPTVGQPGLRLGAPREGQDPAFLARINQLPPSFAPFTEADLDLTGWSDRLAGINYLAASPDGAVNQAWGDALQQSLEADGWTPSSRRHLAATGMMDARIYEKTVATAQGPLTLIVQFDTPGSLMLSCGEAALLELAHEEYEGRLAPGTPRPLPPADSAEARLPVEADCADPALLAAFADTKRINEYGPAFRKFAAGSDAIHARKRYHDRLHGWLVWRLLGSGKVTQDRIWELGDKANPGTDKVATELMETMLGQLGQVAQAQEKGDPAAMCRAMAGVIIASANKDRRDTEHWMRANAALEEEARRLGMQLD